MKRLQNVVMQDLVTPGKMSGTMKCGLKAVLVAGQSDTRWRSVAGSRSPRIRVHGNWPVRSASSLHIPQQLFPDRIAVNTGPRAALKLLDVECMCSDERLQWLEQSRVNAVLGSCKHSLKSLRSGYSCFAAFARVADPECVDVIPPKLDLLLSWSSLFRSERTLGNYLGYVKTACLLCGVSVEVFGHDALKRAKNAVAKKQQFIRRPKLWLQRVQLQSMLEWCDREERHALFGALFLFAYAFLLRLPSEALPVTVGQGSGPCALYQDGDMMVLELARRKNKPSGSILRRGCWCGESARTCPLHVLGPLVANCEHGQRLFVVSAACALGILREILRGIGMDKAESYRTHDLRRGHAQDLVESGVSLVVGGNLLVASPCCAGATLAVILAAGEWRSPAFLSYIDEAKLETDVVVAAHVDDSDDDA